MKSKFSIMAIFMIGIVLLVGCTQNTQPTDIREEDWIEVGTDSFSIKMPGEIKQKIYRPDDKSWAYLNYVNNSYWRKPGDYSVHVYEFSPSLHCNNTAMSNPEIIEDGKNGVYTIQGLVDGYAGDYDPPPTPSCFGRGGAPEKFKDEPISYMLCSSKDDVQAAICIYQMTDDPKLVEQIFSTFKWPE